jgi:hypothetical protein
MTADAVIFFCNAIIGDHPGVDREPGAQGRRQTAQNQIVLSDRFFLRISLITAARDKSVFT